MISKLVFLYDTTVKPFGDFDVQAVKALLEKVRPAGTDCELIDTKNVTPPEMKAWRERATIIAVWHHVGVRQPFGSRRGGGLPYLGKQVPALFVYEEGKAKPAAVYPHEKGGKEYSIEGYLKDLLES